LSTPARALYSTEWFLNLVGEYVAVDQLSTTFAALADPTRRAILERLTSGEATVTELAEIVSREVRDTDLFGRTEKGTLSLLLLVTAGLLLRALGTAQRIDPGFRAEGTLAVALDRDDAGELRRTHELHARLGLDSELLLPSEAIAGGGSAGSTAVTKSSGTKRVSRSSETSPAIGCTRLSST